MHPRNDTTFLNGNSPWEIVWPDNEKDENEIAYYSNAHCIAQPNCSNSMTYYAKNVSNEQLERAGDAKRMKRDFLQKIKPTIVYWML